jgi:hypothetical protein
MVVPSRRPLPIVPPVPIPTHHRMAVPAKHAKPDADRLAKRKIFFRFIFWVAIPLALAMTVYPLNPRPLTLNESETGLFVAGTPVSDLLGGQLFDICFENHGKVLWTIAPDRFSTFKPVSLSTDQVSCEFVKPANAEFDYCWTSGETRACVLRNTAPYRAEFVCDSSQPSGPCAEVRVYARPQVSDLLSRYLVVLASWWVAFGIAGEVRKHLLKSRGQAAA